MAALLGIDLGAGSLKATLIDESGTTLSEAAAPIEGMTVIDTTSDSVTAAQMAMLMSRNNCPASSCMKMTGMNTTSVVSVDASTAPQTSLAASYAATTGFLPMIRWSWTEMFTAERAATTCLVMSMSARDGVGSPLGWLWTMMIADAPSSSARLTISRG